MKALGNIKVLGTLLLMISMGGCASARYDTSIGHALAMCKELDGPDADKAHGEARFWLQSERAEVSRKLWNNRGLAAIEARQASSSDTDDLACLAQLHQEASSRRLMRE